MTNRFGKRLYEIFFKTYTEKVWGIPCTEIRAEWAAQRIQGLSLARAILSATAPHAPQQQHQVAHRYVQVSAPWPRPDVGSLPRQDSGDGWPGAHATLGAPRRTGQDGQAKSILAKSALGDVRIKADHVISTTDIRSLVRALGDQAPEPVKQSAEGLRYRDFLVVALILNKENLFPDNWIYVHTPGVK